MAASGEATVTHSRSLEDTAMLSVWINAGNERRAELGRYRAGVALAPFEANLPVSCGCLPLAIENGSAGC
jgi:hypothetical protein